MKLMDPTPTVSNDHRANRVPLARQGLPLELAHHGSFARLLLKLDWVCGPPLSLDTEESARLGCRVSGGRYHRPIGRRAGTILAFSARLA